MLRAHQRQPNPKAFKTPPWKKSFPKISKLAATDKVQPAKTFHDLPAEIRNTIYELTLTNQTIRFPKASKSNAKGQAAVPGILMASKQIKSEVLSMFYNKATFEFEDLEKMFTWLRKLGAKKRKLLKEVLIDVDEVAVSDFVALRSMERKMHREVHEQLVTIERRLKDYGVALPMEVYKVKRTALSAGIKWSYLFRRWEYQKRICGSVLKVLHFETENVSATLDEESGDEDSGESESEYEDPSDGDWSG